MRLTHVFLSLAVYASAQFASDVAQAQKSCSPAAPGARILRSPDVNDIHPDWRPPAVIGTSWSLLGVRREREFLSGRLVSPRGGVQRGRVYVIPSEWLC
jgi:hypothetical protein